MIDILIVFQIIIILLLIIASIYDFVKREIPDEISYSLIALAILNTISMTLVYDDISFVLYGLVFGIVFYLIAYAFAYYNLWGGADSKFLIAMAIYFSNLFMMLDFIINFLIVAFFFSSSFLKIKTAISYKRILNELKFIYCGKVNLILYLFLIISFFIPVLAVYKLIFILLLLLLILYVNRFAILSIESKIFFKSVKAKDLVEGDWLLFPLKFKNKFIKNEPMGLSLKTIDFLKKNYKKTIDIKWGVPFIPVFLITFLFTVYLDSNLLLLFLNWIMI